jgi:hypothetical protein
MPALKRIGELVLVLLFFLFYGLVILGIAQYAIGPR